MPVPNDTYRFTGWEIVVNGQTREYSDAEAILSHYADLPVETDLTFIAKFLTVSDSTISVWFSGTNLRDGFDGKESIYPDNGISGDTEWVGKDVYKRQEEYVDMIEAGILDPAKVTRSALQNATSVASTLLTTESVVANIKEAAPAPAGAPDMGGMY